MSAKTEIIRILSEMQDPCYITEFKKMPFRDFNRDWDGKQHYMGIYADDNFYCVAKIPSELMEYDLKLVLKTMWPELESEAFTIGFDNDSKEYKAYNDMLTELSDYSSAFYDKVEKVIGTVTNIEIVENGRYGIKQYTFINYDTKEEDIAQDFYLRLYEYDVKIGDNIGFGGKKYEGIYSIDFLLRHKHHIDKDFHVHMASLKKKNV